MGRNNKEISEFNYIPMNDYMDFIDVGDSPEDNDIRRKPHKRHSNAHTTMRLSQDCQHQPLEVHEGHGT